MIKKPTLQTQKYIDSVELKKYLMNKYDEPLIYDYWDLQFEYSNNGTYEYPIEPGEGEKGYLALWTPELEPVIKEVYKITEGYPIYIWW